MVDAWAQWSVIAIVVGLVLFLQGVTNMAAAAQDPAKHPFAEGNRRLTRPARNLGLAVIGAGVVALVLSRLV